jgi:hypothetical protein
MTVEIDVFHHVIGDCCRRYADMRACGQPIPAWLRKQADAILLMETDPLKGISLFIEGMQDEVDRLKEILHHG